MKKSFIFLLLFYTRCLIPFSPWDKAQEFWFIEKITTKYLSTKNLKNQFLYDNNFVQSIQSIQDEKIKHINQAEDLSTIQKTILKYNLKKINITFLRLFLESKINEDTLVSIFDCLPLTDKQLEKYFILGLWINHKKKYEYKEPLSADAETYSSILKKNWIKYNPIVGIYDFLPIADRTKILSTKLNDYDSKFAIHIANHSNLINQIETIEKDFAKHGYITFVHGRAWEWNFFNQICHMIATIKNLKHHQDRESVILRLRKDDVDPLKLETYRDSLMHLGDPLRVYSTIDHKGSAAEPIFMNRSILKNNPCSSRVFNNYSAANPGKALEYAKKMIKEHNFERYVDDKKLIELYEQHHECSEIGEIVYIAIDKKYVDNMVYICSTGDMGYKKSYRSTLNLIQEEEQEIFNSKIITYEKSAVYCLAVANMPNEEKICVTRSLHAANSEKFAQFKQDFAEFQKQIQAQYLSDQ